jgi:anthranilate phosphoribosyltransferase
MIVEAIEQIAARRDLSESEAEAVMSRVIEGEASPAQIGALLLALRMKGETREEIVGCARALQRRAIPVEPQRKDLVDLAGTGGDRMGTFNISTTAAFVVAGAGLAVAKHVDRSVSSRCGSAELLRGLGIELQISAQHVGACIDEIGIGFLYAPQVHPAIQYAIVPRRQIGVRTMFDLLGPLSNPSGAKARVLGVYSGELTELVAEALADLGSQRAFVVYGTDGLDELSTAAINRVSRLAEGKVTTFMLDAVDLGLPRSDIAELRGGLPAHNVFVTRAVLDGARGAARDIVLLNAAAGLVAGEGARDLGEGIAMAAESIDSGRAKDKLLKLIAFTQEGAWSANRGQGEGR